MNYREEEENEAAAEEFAEARRTEEPITRSDAIKRAEAALQKWETHLPLKLGRPLPVFDTIDCINALRDLLASPLPEPAACPDCAGSGQREEDGKRFLAHDAALRRRVAELETALNRRDALLLDIWDSHHREGWEKSETFDSVMDRLSDWRWNNGYDPCNPPMQPDPRAALAKKEAGRG